MAEIKVGIKDLKANLSRYMREVKKGRSVVITERGVPIGRIIPKRISIGERTEALIDAGILQWNREPLKPTMPTVKNSSHQLISDLVVGMRE
ncbi:MAG: type II toxin-antitoxin system prevent-host-death family antitoxin [Anaerolineales bacterium]|nr:MAG: type II toxin-antitoxin system prevent-host-death family antitoxin [Anaerolineales bacterium]